jgi:signal transduction histidine kinase
MQYTKGLTYVIAIPTFTAVFFIERHYLDSLTLPHIIMRFALIPWCILVIQLYKLNIFQKNPAFISYLVAVYVCYSYIYFSIAEPSLLAFYMRVFTQTLLVLSLLPYSVKEYLTAVLIPLSGYLVMVFIHPTQNIFSIHLASPDATAVDVSIALLAFFVLYQNRKKLAESEEKLEKEIQNRGIIIEEKAEELAKSRIALSKEKAFRRKTEEIRDIARKVAHDIRSPLAALNSVAKSLDEVTSDKKHIILNVCERINNIAQDLLSRYSADPNGQLVKSRQESQGSDLLSCVRKILSEKNLNLKISKNLN